MYNYRKLSIYLPHFIVTMATKSAGDGQTDTTNLYLKLKNIYF